MLLPKGALLPSFMLGPSVWALMTRYQALVTNMSLTIGVGDWQCCSLWGGVTNSAPHCGGW